MTTARHIAALVVAVACVVTGCVPAAVAPESPTQQAPDPRAEKVMTIVHDAMAGDHLRSVIVRVTEDGTEVVTEAVGDSMTGVPATTGMHFRNGAVAISYVATLLLILAQENKLRLDDTLSTWLPDFPNADRVTLGQLAQMTSGYRDYVIGNDAFADAVNADPFRAWTTDELLRYATPEQLLYEPGTNWNYAHTNYLLLGLAIEQATGQDISKLLSDKVLRPLGLTNTAASLTAAIPGPALHAFTSERRAFLGIPRDTPFYEESSFWNPSWTITHGAIQTSNIYDLEATAVGIGSGKLLSPDSYRKMVSTDLRGKTHAQPGCPTCAPQGLGYTYGLGIVISGNWLLQNPMFAGYAATEAYLPAKKLAIAVAVTFAPEAFDTEGGYTNRSEALFRAIGRELVPDDAPPEPPAK